MQTGNPLIGMMADVLGVDVAPKVKEVRETLQSLRELAESVNATVEMFNNLPFVDLATIGDATQKIVDLFDQVSAAIDEIQAGVGKLKQNVSGSVIDPIQSQSRKVDQILGEAQAEVQTLQRKVNLAYELMVVVGPRIPQIIAVISVLITVLLVWGILAQIAMIYLAWLYWKFGRLDLHKALPATAEA
jgi:phage-related protein